MAKKAGGGDKKAEKNLLVVDDEPSEARRKWSRISARDVRHPEAV